MELTNPVSKGRLWTSYILQGIIAAMFLMGAINNLLQTEMAVNGATQMGYPRSAVFYLGITLLVSTILYVMKKTTFLGALLLTAWLGGAVATHIINSDPMYYLAFPITFGTLVWLSIWLRNEKLQQLLPLTR